MVQGHAWAIAASIYDAVFSNTVTPVPKVSMLTRNASAPKLSN